MVKKAVLCVLCFTLFPIHGQTLAYPPDGIAEEPGHGAITRGKVVVCAHDEEKITMNALVFGLQDDTASVSLLCAFSKERPLRWHVRHGYFWPTDSFFINDSYKARTEVRCFQLDGLLAGKLLNSPRGDVDAQGAAWNRSLVISDLLNKVRFIGAWSTDFPTFLEYDHLPFSEEETRLFVVTNVAVTIRNRTGPGGVVQKQDYEIKREDALQPRWTFSVYGLRRIYDKEKKEWDAGAYILLEHLPVTFREPFQVLSFGKDYYFLTASGKLYCTGSRRILTGQRSIEPVWDDATRPITHFITDADTDRTFLFCKPAKKGDLGVFFEMGPKPEPKPYDLSKVKPAKIDEPLKSVLERARFLADQKLLKNP